MSTDFTDVPPPPGPPTGFTRVPRGHPLIAWGVIVAVLAALLTLHFLFQPPADVKELTTFEIQGRYLVGLANMGLKPPNLYEQAQMFNRGPAGQRLRFVVLAGELKDSEEALKQVDALKEQLANQQVPDADPEDAETADILGRLYRDYTNEDMTAPDVTAPERAELKRRLGWFGELALCPPAGPYRTARAAVLAPAERAVVATLGILLAALAGGGVGFVLLILFAVLWQQMRARFRAGSPFGGLYAEAFAVWLVLFFGLSLLLKWLAPHAPLALAAGIPQALSLIAVGWPVLRGAPWRQVRKDIGWVAGDRPLLEPLCGVLCYLAALPVLLLLMLGFSVLLREAQKWGGHNPFGPEGVPTHPAVPAVLHGDWTTWIQVLFVASIMAPILEETMFRGVLYRHLREATAGFGRGGSVIVSALAAAFLFAAPHPQGLLAAPMLMVLACGFTAAREWRGSLIPSMTVHALHNGALMLIVILLAS